MPKGTDDSFPSKPISLFDHLSEHVPDGWREDCPSIFLARLDQFESETDSIALSDGTLRRLTPNDVAAIRECDVPSLGLPGIGAWHDFGDSYPWVFEVPIEPTNYYGALAQARSVGEKLNSALGIFDRIMAWSHEPAVYQAGITRSASRLSYLATTTLGDAKFSVPSRNIQRIDEDRLGDFRVLYEAQSTMTDRRLRIAIRRFNQSRRRDDDTDALIDLWIGLEALFSDSPGDVTYKAAMRAALFLEEPGELRKDLFKELKDSYGVRSDLVHGREHPQQLHEIRGRVREVLRESLRRLLLSGRVPEPHEYDHIALGTSG